MHQQDKKKYIPLNVGETAVLNDANTLLPREEIYERLSEFIYQARKRAISADGKQLNELRAHNAISIDGARGTGKTAVLVNLKHYLKLEHNELLSDIHILEPIDPTLLEDGDSLFLHIIVAAILHDDGIKRAQREKPELSRSLNQALEKLTHSLEGVDTQKNRYGMDKVRAMYGNKHLADCVQDFFKEIVQLIGKKLIILPIDDVDTSLNRAFENLEIIRRYLTTPYVLPIVSGDRSLYNEVTWRDFHGRLTKDSEYLSEPAYDCAVELAEEYQRKILPFPRRLTMPTVSSYWQKADTYLRDDEHGDIMPLRNFIAWLEIYLMGPVNGQEDSHLVLPIPSIRSLTQLIDHCSSFIPQLPDEICRAKNRVEVHRIWQMPTTSLKAISEFQERYKDQGEKTKRDYSEAYKIFAEQMNLLPDINYLDSNTKALCKNTLTSKLTDYFRFEPKAGAIYLILLTKQHWNNWNTSSPKNYSENIFNTPLFQPLSHAQSEFILFDKKETLSEWDNALSGRLPAEWLTGLKSYNVMLPYPIPEIGINTSVKWKYSEDINELNLIDLDQTNKYKASFLISLLAQYNFYTNTKQTMLLNIGRVFEIIIVSLLGDVSKEKLQSILTRAPFFSTRALAPTKTLIDNDEVNDEDDEDDEQENADVQDLKEIVEPEFDAATALVEEINIWRKDHNLDQINLSPWLTYKVFNKVYSQNANSKKYPNGMKDIHTALNIVAQTFYATWSAFGSFEKGELFGLPNVIATVNLSDSKLENFENNDLFNINLSPFAPSFSQKENEETSKIKNKILYGKQTQTISYYLADHPLRNWINELMNISWPKSGDPEKFLRVELNIGTKGFNKNIISNAAKRKKKDERNSILEKMRAKFGDNNKDTEIFADICKKLDEENINVKTNS